MEAIIDQLCKIFPANVVQQGVRVLRWTLVLRAYQKIKALVVQCPKVMNDTGIQLIDINQSTLTQWFNRKSKQTERQVLEQGITLPKPSTTAPCLLPAALTRPTELVSGTSERHQFVLPINAAGTAKTVRRQRALLPKPPVAVLPSYSLSEAQFPPGAVFISTPPVDTVPAAEPELPRSTMAYRRKRIEAELQGSVRQQGYNWKEGTICGQCGQQRLAESHRQY